MKKRIFILILLFSFFIQDTNAIVVKTSIDMSWLLPWICAWKECNVPNWVSGLEIVSAWIIKYITLIASLLAVLFIVVNWILYAMSWMDQSLKDTAKKRIQKTLIWLVLLLISWAVLKIIAPWAYT